MKCGTMIPMTKAAIAATAIDAKACDFGIMACPFRQL
jgi:hypothetical protein